MITTSNANNFQTTDKPRIPLSSLSASMENDNLEKQKELEIVISNKCISNTDNSSINLTDPSLEHVSLIDSTDLANWPKNLSRNEIDFLITQGPVKALVKHYPCDNKGRDFSDTYYTRKLPNNELIIRRWLVYSKSSDKVFCFCCSIFKIDSKLSWSNEGYCDWIHLSTSISIHKNSANHKNSYVQWTEAEKRLKNNTTIDHLQQSLICKRSKTLE